MDEPRQALMNLIVEVSRLCERTRELATVETRDPTAIAPVRQAVGVVSQAMEICQAVWSAEALAHPGPAAPLPQEPEAESSWLLGDDLV